MSIRVRRSSGKAAPVSKVALSRTHTVIESYTRCARAHTHTRSGKQRGVRLCVQLQLGRVVGLTARRHHALATHDSSGYVVYPAGCLCIVYDPKTNTQVRGGGI